VGGRAETGGREEFRRRVVAALGRVGRGEVVSYGELAAEAGYPGGARGVGAVLASSPPGEGLAWWRVVYADGRLPPGHEAEGARRLRSEGVVVSGGRVAGFAARAARVPGPP
jgi:alkylated DNA nucleotide flippase Atl1